MLNSIMRFFFMENDLEGVEFEEKVLEKFILENLGRGRIFFLGKDNA